MQKHFFYKEEVASTQDWAREAVPTLSLDDVSVFVAQRQTAGRGRGGRVWQSSTQGNLYVTLATKIPQNVSIAPFSLVAAMVMCQTLEKWGFVVRIKWPNDLLIDGQKVGGILCEVVSYGEEQVFLCGVGLNVNMPSEALREIDRPATSLSAVRGRSFSTQAILERFVDGWADAFSTYLRGGFPPFYQAILPLLSHCQGDRLRVHRGKEIVEGTFQALTEEGGCVLVSPSGEKSTLYSGEIL